MYSKCKECSFLVRLLRSHGLKATIEIIDIECALLFAKCAVQNVP